MESDSTYHSPAKQDKAIVTQSQLQEMRRLREQQQQHDQLREELIALPEDGAEIEPGPLAAYIDHQSQQRISGAKLSEIVGANLVEEWKHKVAPTIFTVLKIEDNVQT